MSETITFETAALADVVTRAARVAPTKGAAFDRSSGLLMAYDPNEADSISIKATDLDVTFLETMRPLASTMPGPFKWRIPSLLIAGIVSGLPLGTETKLENKEGILHITCGKSKSKIRLYNEITFDFDPIDQGPLVEVPGFAARVQQVAWACSKDTIPFTGVHIDGKNLIATDRYRVAVVPLEVPVVDPITVPLDILNNVSKNVVDAKIAVVGRRFHIMPTDHAEVTTVIYDSSYPEVDRVMWSKANGDYDQSFVVDKEALRAAINRMLVLVKGERYPVMEVTIGEGRLFISMNVEDVGEMEDEVTVIGADHPDFKILFTPLNFVDGLMHTAKNEVTVAYNTTMPTRNILFEDGDGYRCWVVPRRAS